MLVKLSIIALLIIQNGDKCPQTGERINILQYSHKIERMIFARWMNFENINFFFKKKFKKYVSYKSI
jgi:hypothetical protein